MSSRVSLSRRDAEEVLQAAASRQDCSHFPACVRLRSALAPKPKRVAATKAHIFDFKLSPPNPKDARNLGCAVSECDCRRPARYGTLPKEDCPKCNGFGYVPKRLAAKKTRTAAKATKRATKNAETSDIRRHVEIRAMGRCECGCGRPFTPTNPMELDHFWGRARARQSMENTWGLAPICHRMKTRWHPARRVWLVHFATHCLLRGYPKERAKAQRAILALDEVQAAAAVTKGEG